MNRARIISRLGAALVAVPAIASAKELRMTSSHPFDEVLAKRSAATSLTVFHVSGLRQTLTGIHPSALETYQGVEKHSTQDAKTIADAFTAIEAAHPDRTAQTAEYRWKLVFEDTTGTRILELYATAYGPYLGMLDTTPIRYTNDHLIRWLTETYAPSELPSLKST
ncbi:MAG: hypothetical protein JO103_14545 [Candidatus Eremiobacteraeota bacterium]|nr:hypothetical protein [Candidatus Eremiobacteraeota bacterium]